MKSNTILLSLAVFAALFVISHDGFGADLSTDGGGELLVPCNLDGSTDFCQLDTGARDSTVNIQDDDWLKAHPVTGVEELAGLGGVVKKYPVTIVKAIQLGDLSAQNIPFVLDRDFIESNIGGNLIATMMSDKAGLYFDFSKMKLEPATQADFNSLHTLAVVNDTPLMPASIGNQAVTLVWDTGNSNSTIVSQKFIQDNPQLFVNLHKSLQIADVNGRSVGVGLYTCKELGIGDLVFKNVTVIAMDLTFMNQRLGASFQGVLGTDIIYKANWFLNYKTLKWTAQRNYSL